MPAKVQAPGVLPVQLVAQPAPFRLATAGQLGGAVKVLPKTLAATQRHAVSILRSAAPTAAPGSAHGSVVSVNHPESR